ncbi:hypothetical protein [Robertmurraya massiliosenegalensis]|nr:hypothetical protein [Robertmurraya massiliosenegalensis]
MSNATETLEGWYSLIDFRKIDWKSWKALTDHQREKIGYPI